MVGPIEVKQKEMSQLGATDEGIFDHDLWPWIFKVKLYLGNRRPIVMERRGRELIGCPDVKH